MHKKDLLHRFLIESADTRGSLVSLDDTWREARGRVAYPPAIQQVLGHGFAASVLLATTIKFEGKMTLQIRGDGPIHLLVIQVTAEQKMRGLARWSSVPQEHSLQALFGSNARMTITIEAKASAEPYQGIVALEGETLGDALRDYFRNSEQLDTELVLAVDENSAVGLLLQKLPQGNPVLHSDVDADAWNRALVLTHSVTSAELLSLPAEQLLRRLYHEEQVRLFDPQPVAFECSCSTERTNGLILGLGVDEAQDILREQGDITITCEFCDEVYRYDTDAVAALFNNGESSGPIKGPTLH